MEYIDEFVEEFDRRVEAVTQALCRTLHKMEETKIVVSLGLCQALIDVAKDEPREEIESLFNTAKEMCLSLKENAQ